MTNEQLAIFFEKLDERLASKASDYGSQVAIALEAMREVFQEVAQDMAEHLQKEHA